MADKFLVISSIDDDGKELSKINNLIVDKYRDQYVATTDQNDVLFKYSHEFESTLKNILRKPEFINTQVLLICEYTFDESTGEWLEESDKRIFEKGYDVEDQNLNDNSGLSGLPEYDNYNNNNLSDLPEYDNYSNLPEVDNYSNTNQYNDNNNGNYTSDVLSNYDLSYDDIETKSIDEIQEEDNKRYNTSDNIQNRIENSKNNNSINQDDILYEIVYDVLPTSDEIIDKLNTNLNVNDTFENPMSTVVRIIHNSTLQQLYSRVEDKIDELYNQDVDGSLDDYRQKLLDNPPKILQDLKDEVIKFRTFSKDSSNDIDKIRSNYEKDLEKYVKEAGEQARIEAENYARQEYINQNENQTDNQIAEYVNSIKDTYDSMEENIDILKDRAARTLINDFIKHGQNPALSSALRFIKDKKEIEKQAQNDIDAINQSAYNAQNMQFNQPQLDNNSYMSADNFEAIDDLMIQNDDDDDDDYDYDYDNENFDNTSEDDLIDDEMNADEIANSMNNIQDNDDDDENEESESDDISENDEFEHESDKDDESESNESDESDENDKSEDIDDSENSEETSLDHINEEDLNEIDDEDINIKQPEEDDQSEEEGSDDTPPSETPDTELNDEDEEDSLNDENENDEKESDNESYLDESKGKFKKAIQGNLYDNEENDDEDLFDQINEDQLDKQKGIENDIIDDMNDVDTSKDLDSISETSSEDKKNSKFSKWVMGIIIAIVVLIILALGTLFVVSEFSDDTEEEKKAEQKAQAEHEQYLRDLKTYILGTDQVVQMGDQTVKVTISKINKDGSVEAEYNDKNKDGEVVKEHTTIDKPVIQTALEKQKKQANKTHNKTIDDEINKDNASDDK